MRCGCRCTTHPVTAQANVFDPELQLGQDCSATSASGTRWATPFSIPASALLLQLVLGLRSRCCSIPDRKGYGILRALMTLPLVVPPAVTAMMFLLMLDGSFGVLSRSLYRARAAVAAIIRSWPQLDRAWPACCWPTSGNGRRSWC